ncbi:MAG: hypothetical protein GWP08_01600 [Nitrospiraceae bacterium]|nr:hypothetical protein [Nitrospiraceae bacterium]
MYTHRVLIAVLTILLCMAGLAGQANAEDERILLSPDASPLERLAAAEVRRYVYQRTGTLLTLREGDAAREGEAAVVVATKNRKLASLLPEAASLAAQEYRVKSVAGSVYLVGGDEVGTLYAAYRFAEILGARFYLHGDVVPDARVPFVLPQVDEHGSPLFALRGIQPFHDFPEGPDWWNTDHYLAVLAQLPKLRMNFFGLHTYPEKRPNAEPTVWIGVEEDLADDGTVAHAYPALYYNTALNASWGFSPKKTSDYSGGGAQLFAEDVHGNEVQQGLYPMSNSPDDCNTLFNRTGAMLREAFTMARRLGIKTCVGTETPLVVPERVRERLEMKGEALDDDSLTRLYAGMFKRIERTYPIDYYWLWTPEGWTWEGTKPEQIDATLRDIKTAYAALDAIGKPFQLATCGWVLGPPANRALFDQVLPKDMPVSCINRGVGHEPVEPGFADVEGRPQWAIPWLEDDPAMTSPQLWVSRMRRDAFDALEYGCTGLMGIHWRTRILGPNVSALAQAAWTQEPWDACKEPSPGAVGGRLAHFERDAVAGTEDDPLYQHVRYDMRAYRFAVADGTYNVTLQFCENRFTEAGKRVFDVKIEGKPILENLDIFARAGADTALDYTFDGITVDDGRLDIEFVARVEYPCIAAIAVEGEGGVQKVNCGGEAYRDYAEDFLSEERRFRSDDFYGDWALSLFGPEVAKQAAEIFVRVDGQLPRPSDWIGGPGGYRFNPRPWEKVADDYAYVDDFAALRGRVRGAGNLERFDYWLNSFQFMRATARMCCVWGEFEKARKRTDAALKECPEAMLPEKRREAAKDKLLPAYRRLVQAVDEALHHLLASITTTGGMGNLTNLEQHTFPGLLEKNAKDLEDMLGESLPDDARPARVYGGPPRAFLTAVRGLVRSGESLDIQATYLADVPPKAAWLYYRPLGAKPFQERALAHKARGVYTATLEADAIGGEDFEYYLRFEPGAGATVYWPPTAPELNQTVVVMPNP